MSERIGGGRRGPLVAALLVIVAVVASTVWVRRSAGLQADSVDAAAARADGTASGVAPPAAAGGVGARARGSTVPPTAIEDVLERRIALRERLRERQAKDADTRRARMETSYRSEGRDPAWSQQKQGELARIAAAPEFKVAGVEPLSMDVDCRQTVCRVTSTFARDADAQDWTQFYLASAGSALPTAVVRRTPNPDGSTRVEIYGRGR